MHFVSCLIFITAIKVKVKDARSLLENYSFGIEWLCFGMTILQTKINLLTDWLVD